MNKLKNYFLNRHVILPVIHVANKNQAIHNAAVARDNGCDGVFLINHDEISVPWEKLLEIHSAIREKFPTFWLGVNCLDLSPAELFSVIPNEVSGIWTDNARINENLEYQEEAEIISEEQKKKNWKGIYFGGVAFKYQRSVNDIGKAAKIATHYMDVVTTSGPGTGKEADIGKISTMKKSIGDFPLAIASGITPENIGNYLTIADCFLVSTGISKNFLELDPILVSALIKKVR